jgi:hypothetical protein
MNTRVQAIIMYTLAGTRENCACINGEHAMSAGVCACGCIELSRAPDVASIVGEKNDGCLSCYLNRS